MSDEIRIGEAVAYSPVGPGIITGFTERGYPQVNNVACATIIFADGSTFNPHNHDLEALKAHSDKLGKANDPDA